METAGLRCPVSLSIKPQLTIPAAARAHNGSRGAGSRAPMFTLGCF